MCTNLLLMTDSYKASHAYQYPAGTEYVYSYIESRGGIYDKTVFFGLQMFLKKYLSKPISVDDIDQAEEFWKAHGEPFYREHWDYIVRQYNGYLPVIINAAPEGTVIDTHNVLMTIRNTDPRCWWLTSFLETALLRAVWYPTTVATVSYMCKQIIKKNLEETSEDIGQLAFKLHDFGARGVSSPETAGIGGAAHLVNFMGSDTVEGVLYASKYYHEKMAGFSIPAAEHSTITSWGKENEEAAYRNMLNLFAKPNAIVAVVSDSYDIMNAVNNIWGDSLKNVVMESGGTLVVRPDSGDPLTMPVEVIKALGEKFGFTVNKKGFKVLPSCVRVIQGDGITVDSLPIILDNLKQEGWSGDNIAFGMGGGLLQHVNRDTFKFAMKCSAACVKGKWRDVYKSPIGDQSKSSKRGTLALIHEEGKYQTVPRNGNAYRDLLYTVFRNGEIQRETTFAEVRQRANS